MIALLTADWIASGSYHMLAILGLLAVTAFVTAGLQRNAWILLVIGWQFKGSIHALPIPMAAHDIVVLLVMFAYIAQRVVGQTTNRSRGVLGALVMMNCLWVACTFVFHPVGIHALGAETMGGRPYFNVFIGLCAYWILVYLPESYTQVTKIPLWLMGSLTFCTALSVLVYIVPSLTPYVWFFYSDVDISSYIGSVLHPTGEEPELQRFLSLGTFGLGLIQFVGAYYPPRKFLNPLRWQFLLTAVGIAAILASGFRSSLAFALASIVLASWFHRGWREVVLGGLLGGILLGFLCYGQGRYFQLPLTAQRALGSLPGQWDEEISQQIKTSNDRWHWWVQVIHEGVIKNWWIGDGFGMSETDYDLMAGGQMSFYESAEIAGIFHNGPLTAIHSAGVVGLVLYYALIITTAVYSVKLVNRCRGTPLFPATVFLAVQVAWAPIQYTFIFGSYASNLPDQLFMAGLLTLVWHMSEQQPPKPLATVQRPVSWNHRPRPVPL
ncbi:MAG TPA: O-antigen ligase family protein [Verrucomicrobiae bacterium]|nr:O-antigen ligase family protein [Verrucomicrobiae bacterium]